MNGTHQKNGRRITGRDLLRYRWAIVVKESNSDFENVDVFKKELDFFPSHQFKKLSILRAYSKVCSHLGEERLSECDAKSYWSKFVGRIIILLSVNVGDEYMYFDSLHWHIYRLWIYGSRNRLIRHSEISFLKLHSPFIQECSCNRIILHNKYDFSGVTNWPTSTLNTVYCMKFGYDIYPL